MRLATELLDTLVCPKSKQPVIYFPRGEHDRDEADGFLLCPASRLRYRIDLDDGYPIAVLLVEEATELPASDVERLVKRARELDLRVP